ncbi:GPW/gp25 family protein [Novosphingobium gossypii]|uniref:hypothetical protein n=1 Tax=Novosphingobium gossypii TaxID=1604774 RepID=UPI003D1E298A
MAGMSRTGGTALDGIEHIAQSVREILGTPRRIDFGIDLLGVDDPAALTTQQTDA